MFFSFELRYAIAEYAFQFLQMLFLNISVLSRIYIETVKELIQEKDAPQHKGRVNKKIQLLVLL